MVGVAYAQRNLPACSSIGFYHQCFVTYTTHNGDKYIGEWGDRKISKEGVFTSSTGKLVEKFNGAGIAIFKDGHKFIGEFKDGKPSGEGILFESNGSVINQGNWADGSFLSSTFQDPSYNGQGVYTDKGNKYVGAWRYGKYNGQGTFTFFSGSKYVGEFKDNQFSGQGTLYASNGLVVVTGIWANGKFVRSESLQKSSLAELNSSNCAKPEYPSTSKRLEEEGSVEVIFLVEADGKVNAAAVEKSSGFRRLDEAATRGVSSCQFKPLNIGGITRQSWASMKFTFGLETTTQSNVQTAIAMDISASNLKIPAPINNLQNIPPNSYAQLIGMKIFPNITFTEEVVGNPKAEVEVHLAVDGVILGRKLLSSSGIKSWDDAVLKAIDKTKKIPKDIDGSVPPILIISFRPRY